jgi:hypothetical protein
MGMPTIPLSTTSISQKERLFLDVDLPKCFGMAGNAGSSWPFRDDVDDRGIVAMVFCEVR